MIYSLDAIDGCATSLSFESRSSNYAHLDNKNALACSDRQVSEI